MQSGSGKHSNIWRKTQDSKTWSQRPNLHGLNRLIPGKGKCLINTGSKEAKKFIEELKTGDKVVTIGGAHGTIVTIREKTIVVEVDSSKGVRMVFEKTAVSKDASSRLTEE